MNSDHAKAHEHEYALVAAMLEQPEISDSVSLELFDDLQCVAITKWLQDRRRNKVKEWGWAERMNDLAKFAHHLYQPALLWGPLCHSPANWPYWVEICQEKLRERRIANLGRELSAADKGQPPDIQEVTRRLREIEAAPSAELSSETAGHVDKMMERLEAKWANGGGPLGIVTGFRELDFLTDGLVDGNLWIVAARPGGGKTTFACNLACDIALKANIPVAYYVMEMPGHQMSEKITCLHANVSASKLRRMLVSDAEAARFESSAIKLKTSCLTIMDRVSKVEFIREDVLRRKPRVIFVDYLQQFKTDGQKPESRWQVIGDVSNYLKRLAMETSTTVVALCQLKRDGEMEKRRPQLSDMKGSSDIEADADVLCALWADEQKAMSLFILKNRMGATGQIPLRVDWETGRMNEPLPDEP